MTINKNITSVTTQCTPEFLMLYLWFLSNMKRAIFQSQSDAMTIVKAYWAIVCCLGVYLCTGFIFLHVCLLTCVFFSLSPYRTKIGVFFCGPKQLSSTLHKACNQHSSKEGAIFYYNKENFWYIPYVWINTFNV